MSRIAAQQVSRNIVPRHCRQRRGVVAIAAAVSALAFAPRPSRAADRYWVDTSNTWTANFWATLPGGAAGASVPINGDTAYITFGDAVTRTVTFNANPIDSLVELRLDNTGTGSSAIQQSQGSLGALTETIGFTGNAAYTLTAGTNNAGTLYVGGGQPAKGAYTLNGNAVLNTSNAYVGFFGNGNFVQSAGTVNANVTLTVGSQFNGTNAAAFGQYNLSGGAIGVGIGNSGTLTVGDKGVGFFNQTGGSVNTYDLFVGKSANGTNALGAGGYSLTNAASVLTVRNGATIGDAGSGTFTQSAGAVTLTQNQNTFTAGLTIGRSVGGSGTYTLNGGALSVLGNANEFVGLGGAGTFNQNGGTNNTGPVVLGFASNASGAPSAGTYNLAAGSLTTAAEYIGYGGVGAFNQTNGAHVVTTNLTIGNTGVLGTAPASAGTLNLSGGTLNVGTYLYAGQDGSATINQTGGTLTVGTWTFLGYGQAYATGVPHSGFANYTLSGGTFNSPGQSVGYFGTNTSTLTQTGGVNNSTNFITVGDQPGNTGVYNLQNGVINANAINDAWLGNGAFNHTGGTNNVVSLRLGHEASGVGTYTLSAGTLNAGDAANPNVYGFLNGTVVGYAGSGNFVQTGGAHAITQGSFAGLLLGYLPGSVGSYRLDNGTLNVKLSNAETYLGYEGTGTFVQNGGTHTATLLTAGYTSAATGSYTLNAGTLTVTQTEYIGLSGRGSFTQTGGAHAAPTLLIGMSSNGTNAASNGSFQLAGGSLAVANQEQIGIDGVGAFVQDGGFHTITSANPGTDFGLILGANRNGVGSYTLNLGNLILNGDENVGLNGAGSFVQNGGGHTVNGTLYVSGGSAGSPVSTFALNGGVLNAKVFNFGLFTIGNATFNGSFSNSGTLNLNGGIVGGVLTQTAQAVLNATAFDATTASVTNAGTINIATNATFSPGGAFNNNGGAVNLAGGALAAVGPILNNGNITGWGTLNGNAVLTNNGVITQTAGNLAFAPLGGVANNGQIALAAGHQLTLTNSLTNNASLDLNNAVVGGPASLLNNSAGVITGPGTVAAPFTNSGTILVPAGSLNVLLPYISTGTIQLDDFTARLTGGSIGNTGTLQGHGAVTSPVANDGAIEAIGGTLTLATGLTNSATGALRAGNGSKLLISQGLANNLGTINLAGGAFDNNGHTLNNPGQIAVTAGANNQWSGPITNPATGKIIVSGGAAVTFAGPITSVAGAEIRVGVNSTAVFLGSVNGPATFNGAGTKYFEGGFSSAGPIAAGGVTVVESAAALTTDYVREHSLTVSGNVTFRPNSPTSVVNDLTISPGGTLDLANTALIVDYTGASPLTSIRSAILNHAITSTSLTSATGIGFAEAADVLGAAGGTFRNQPTDGTAVLARYTLLGDATLDGIVDFNDLVKLAQNYNTPVSATTDNWWSHGDFTGDGITDFNDLVKLAQNYNTALPANGAIPGASAPFESDLARAFASVPEPTPTIVLLGALLAARRSRRRRA